MNLHGYMDDISHLLLLFVLVLDWCWLGHTSLHKQVEIKLWFWYHTAAVRHNEFNKVNPVACKLFLFVQDLLKSYMYQCLFPTYSGHQRLPTPLAVILPVKWPCLQAMSQDGGIPLKSLYPSLQQSWKGGILYWFHLVHLSVCGQNRVRSVSSIILIGSISYLHILSSNFRRCVMCNDCFKIKIFWQIL